MQAELTESTRYDFAAMTESYAEFQEYIGSRSNCTSGLLFSSLKITYLSLRTAINPHCKQILYLFKGEICNEFSDKFHVHIFFKYNNTAYIS